MHQVVDVDFADHGQYCLVPLENLPILDEVLLTGDPSSGGLGYSIPDLAFMSGLMVPYGGLRDIQLQPGQTVVVAPATGPFGGAAVLVALAMGAKVIAMGRNVAKKRAPIPGRIETVPITGDMEADRAEIVKYGEVDAYFDIGPPEAAKSTHIMSCMLALRHGGRVSLMGGYRESKSTYDTTSAILF